MLSAFLLTSSVGILWSLVGLYYKLMAKWNLNMVNISLVTNFISVMAMICFVTKSGEFLSGRLPMPGWFYLSFVIAAGAVNILGSRVLQLSMICRRSGISWAVGQSALVIPFLAITLIFHEPCSWIKLCGTGLILTGMFVLGIQSGKKDQSVTNEKAGFLLALLSFFLLGIAQSMTSSASYFSYRDTGNLRASLQGFGTMIGLLLYKAGSREWSFSFSRKALWLIVLMSLQGIAALYLQFQALDQLSVYGMNGLFFPIALGLCISGYSVYSTLFFKEKATKLFVAGILLILLGILSYCKELFDL